MSRVRPPRSRRARRQIALALCVLWLAGFELLPWMHIALHGHLGKHHHDATGATIIDDQDAETDEHAIAPHDHDADLDAEVDEHGQLAHPADHDDDLDAEVDEHGQPLHHDHEHHDAPADDDRADARLAAALAHGQHSLAHHGIAIPTPPPFLTKPLPVDRRASYLDATAIADPPSFSPGRAVARGPPSPLLG